MRVFNLILVFLSLLIFIPAGLALVKEDQSYLEYLKMKRTALKSNLENVNTKNYVPKDVIWPKNESPKLAPRPNPYRKVFAPTDEDSNRSGMVFYPNLDVEAEKAKLRSVELEIKKLLKL